MSKTSNDLAEKILDLAFKNELTQCELQESCYKAIEVFSKTATIPEKRRLSRSARESLKPDN